MMGWEIVGPLESRTLTIVVPSCAENFEYEVTDPKLHNTILLLFSCLNNHCTKGPVKLKNKKHNKFIKERKEPLGCTIHTIMCLL